MNSSGDALSQFRGDALHFGRQVEKHTWDVIRVQPTKGDQVRPIVIAMVVRMCRTHQAVCNLVASDLNDGAAAVLRGMLEQFVLFQAVRQDPDNLNLAIEEAETQRGIALKGLRNLTEEQRGDAVTLDAINAAVSGINARRSYKFSKWAEATGYEGVYNTIWRSLSDYAHGSLVAVDRYLRPSENGLGWEVASTVEPVTSCEYPINSGGMLLEAVKSFDLAPSTETRRARFDILATNLNALREGYWRIREEDLKGRV